MLPALVDPSISGDFNPRHLPLLSEVQDLAAQSSSVHVHVAQSRPLADARRGFGFDSEGRVDAELLAQLLDVADAEFYVCGPNVRPGDWYSLCCLESEPVCPPDSAETSGT